MNSFAQQFEQLVAALLSENNFTVVDVKSSPAKFDFEAALANDRWAVEVKYYRTKRAQPSLIEKAASELLDSARATNFQRLCSLCRRTSIQSYEYI